MKCIVGLGNTGNVYARTRHNIGVRVINTIAAVHNVNIQSGNGEYYGASLTVDDEEIVLALPTSYMNNSGVAVMDLCRTFNLTADDLLIVLDDFQLPFGTLRIRTQGSDGGHNGLGSIIYFMNTDSIARIRVGVAGTAIPIHHTHDAMAGYVLADFEEVEEQKLPMLLSKAADACLCWALKGHQAAMNAFNKNFFNDSVES